MSVRSGAENQKLGCIECRGTVLTAHSLDRPNRSKKLSKNDFQKTQRDHKVDWMHFQWCKSHLPVFLRNQQWSLYFQRPNRWIILHDCYFLSLTDIWSSFKNLIRKNGRVYWGMSCGLLLKSFQKMSLLLKNKRGTFRKHAVFVLFFCKLQVYTLEISKIIFITVVIKRIIS